MHLLSGGQAGRYGESMNLWVCLHTHQNPELSRLRPKCLFYRADAVNTVHFFAALFTNVGNTLAGNMEVFTNPVFTNVGNTIAGNIEVFTDLVFTNVGNRLAGNIEVFPKAVFTNFGHSPFFFAKVFTVVHEEVQEVEGSGLTPGKCPL